MHSVLHPVIPLDAISRSQLLTERNQNHGHLVIHVLMEFTGPISFSELKAAFTATYLDGDPDSRLHYTIEYGFWTRADRLDLDYHFQDLASDVLSPAIRSAAEIAAIIDRLASEGVNFSYPPWQLVRVSATSCVFRFHHALGDGATMVRQLLATRLANSPHSPQVASEPRRFSLWENVKAGLRLLTVFPDASGVLRLGRRPAKLRTVSHYTNLKHSVAELKRATLTRTLSLTKDVLATIWVSLPRNSLDISDWGNDALGVSYIKLSREYDLTRSLKVTQERLGRVKNSPEPFVVNWALRNLSLVTKVPFIKRFLFPFFTDKASVSVSNLKGPEQLVSWPPGTTHQVKHIHILTPPIMRMGLMVNFFSYAGNFAIGLCGEESVLSELELQRITAALDVAISDLISIHHDL